MFNLQSYVLFIVPSMVPDKVLRKGEAKYAVIWGSVSTRNIFGSTV